jgi:hypothetical protein
LAAVAVPVASTLVMVLMEEQAAAVVLILLADQAPQVKVIMAAPAGGLAMITPGKRVVLEII